VKVIRKDHDRIDAKRPFAACRPEGKPQCSANTFDLRSASVTVKDRNEVAPISDHSKTSVTPDTNAGKHQHNKDPGYR